jgi:hypothetical protein
MPEVIPAGAPSPGDPDDYRSEDSMPVNVKVIHTKDFIKTTPTGVVDLAASKQGILDIASQIKRPGEYEVLIDCRAAEVMLSILDLGNAAGCGG